MASWILHIDELITCVFICFPQVSYQFWNYPILHKSVEKCPENMMISANNGTSNTNKSLTLLSGGWKPHNMLSQLKWVQKIMHMTASLQYYVLPMGWFLWRSWFFRVSGHPENLRIVSFSWIPRFFFLNFRTPQHFFAFAISPGCVNFQNLQAPPNRLVYVCMHRKMPMDPMAMPRDPMCECVYICYNI